MIVRLIAPDWLLSRHASIERVIEGDLVLEKILEANQKGYNVYYFPNSPSTYEPSNKYLDGSDIDKFKWCMVDFDLKSNTYPSKEAFIEKLMDIMPTKIIDSGNGVHAYWKVNDLDVKSYLRLTRRLVRYFNSDEAVGKILQLMRLPGTLNTKKEDNIVECTILHDSDLEYTSEQLNNILPILSKQDNDFCENHYNMTYKKEVNTTLTDVIPPKFGKLLNENHEAKKLWAQVSDDRSKSDFRLGHIMLASGFTKEEATTVLANTAKAMTRSPHHRVNYATNIIDKIWTYEHEPNKKQSLSNSVLEVLSAAGDTVEGERFPCYKYIDNTELGFRLGQVLGLVAGSGVGKTALALNIFMGFVESNPNFIHFFCPLEQTDKEIALRWKIMCNGNTALYDKVHIISNYDNSGTFRDLSLSDIKDYILDFKAKTGKQVGCVVIDHIGVLCNNNKLGQDEGLKQISKAMKGFAVETNTFLIMQSQTSREKAGIGDLELNKDAAFGTSVFENYCDYLITLWQPLKRVYKQKAPTIMAYKFCKIRHKNQNKDFIQEDVPYKMFFDPETQRLRPLTSDEEVSFKYFLTQATNKRKQDRKTELVEYVSLNTNGKEIVNGDSTTPTSIDRHSARH